MKAYLITGGCGFIGVNLIARLAARGDHIRVLDNLSLGRAEDLEPYGVEILLGDVRDSQAVQRAVRGMDAVIHLAAHTRVVESVADPFPNFACNVTGTFNLLRACREAGVGKFILASTGGAILGQQLPPVHEEMVPRPISPYGASKLAAEAYCSAFCGAYGLHTAALRFSNVYGPWSYHKGSVVAQFLKNILEGRPLTIYGDGEQTRDFLFVEDLVQAVLLAEQSSPPGEVFQIASGRETSINQLLDLIREVIPEAGTAVRYQPARPGEIRRNYARIDKAVRLLGYHPRTALREGLARTWQWFLARCPAGNCIPQEQGQAS